MRRLPLFLIALLGLPACSTPSPYRYSAMVPAARPIPFDGRTAEKGTLRVEGAVTKSEVDRRDFPQLHDTAVWVPHTQLEASGAIAVSRKVEIGARFAYTNFDWARASAVGTMPFPNKPSMWGVGPEVRATFPLDREQRFAIGIAGHFMQYRMPIGRWSRTPSCAAGDTCQVDPSSGGTIYRLDEQRLESRWTYAMGVYPTVAFGDRGRYGHLIGHVGWVEGFQNDGFTDTTSSNGEVKSAGAITILGLGYGIRVKPARLAVMTFAPMTSSSAPVRYLYGAFLTLGFDLDLVARDDEQR